VTLPGELGANRRAIEPARRGDELVCPSPGRFRAAVTVGDVIRDGTTLGELDVLGRIARVVAPAGTRGVVTAIADGAVEYHTVLVRIDPNTSASTNASASANAKAASDATAVAGRVFRAPTSGRLYLRPGPNKEPFVVVGCELRAGATVCLLEVMKTFHRATYAGEPARVTALLVADGADVDAGDPLLALE
jgi:acetyl-CoA carboxylase biotin carboxyl carrier protein